MQRAEYEGLSEELDALEKRVQKYQTLCSNLRSMVMQKSLLISRQEKIIGKLRLEISLLRRHIKKNKELATKAFNSLQE